MTLSKYTWVFACSHLGVTLDYSIVATSLEEARAVALANFPKGPVYMDSGYHVNTEFGLIPMGEYIMRGAPKVDMFNPATLRIISRHL